MHNTQDVGKDQTLSDLARRYLLLDSQYYNRHSHKIVMEKDI